VGGNTFLGGKAFVVIIQIFLGTTNFGVTKILGGNCPQCPPPWLRARLDVKAMD